MDELQEIISYLKKLERTIEYNSDFVFMNTRFIKKDKIDNILCCILAKLPNEFKKKMRVADNKYRSVSAFKLLQDNITQKSFFGPSMYKYDFAKSKQLLASLKSYLPKDIEDMNRN